MDGARLLDRVAEALRAQTDALVLCGREEDGFACLPDRPEPGMGPLGGLNAALQYALGNGFDAVLSAGCDIPDLPRDLVLTLAGEGAAIVESQPVIGLWPAALSPALDGYLAAGRRAMYGFAEQASARQVRYDPPIGNINTPGDLALFAPGRPAG